MKKLIETIVSEVMNVLNKKGYSTSEPGSGIVGEQYQGLSGGADGGQGKGRGGGRGQGGGGRGGGKGGGGCGGGGR